MHCLSYIFIATLSVCVFVYKASSMICLGSTLLSCPHHTMYCISFKYANPLPIICPQTYIPICTSYTHIYKIYIYSCIVAGNVGGIIGLTSAYPIDTVKIRIQTRPGVYRGSIDCFTTMVKKEGKVHII
jgi:hypothetical protein